MELSELSYALVVAEPAPATGRCGIDWGEQVVFLAPLTAIGFCPACLYKGAFLRVGQGVEAVRLIDSNANILYCASERR